MADHQGRDGQLEFDLWSLRVFLEVCRTGSMTTAAKRLKLTQPAVSRVIRQLEDAIGLKLIDRELRPLALTTAGGMLRQRAEAILDEALQIVPAVRQATQTKLSSIGIGLIDSVAGLLGPALAVELAEVAAQLVVWSGLSLSHGEALLKRQLDMIVSGDTFDDMDGLERLPLLHEPYVLLLPAGEAAAERSLKQLAGESPLIRYSARSHTGMQIDRHLRRLNIDAPRRHEFDTTDTVAAMVAAGLGWAVTTPICLAGAQCDFSRVTVAPLPGPGFARRITLIARAGELGRIPARTAEISRRLFEQQYVSSLVTAMPWLEPQLRIAR